MDNTNDSFNLFVIFIIFILSFVIVYSYYLELKVNSENFEDSQPFSGNIPEAISEEVSERTGGEDTEEEFEKGFEESIERENSRTNYISKKIINAYLE